MIIEIIFIETLPTILIKLYFDSHLKAQLNI